MDNLSSSNVQCHMADSASIENQISWLQIFHAFFRWLIILICCYSGQWIAKLCKHRHYKPGTVCSVCQTCPTVNIRISLKLQRKIHDLLTKLFLRKYLLCLCSLCHPSYKCLARLFHSSLSRCKRSLWKNHLRTDRYTHCHSADQFFHFIF